MLITFINHHHHLKQANNITTTTTIMMILDLHNAAHSPDVCLKTVTLLL